jgi:putative tryptophan/tyrosine transport system substrate-binding protein
MTRVLSRIKMSLAPPVANCNAEGIARRKVVALLAAMLIALPRPSQAQQARAPSRIGWIGIGNARAPEFVTAVKDGLRELGYVEGSTIMFEERWPKDVHDRVPEQVQELLALNVSVIVAQGQIVPMVRQRVQSTPVVFGYSGDPVEAGLVASLSRPGGNFTGATFMSYEVNAKRLEILHEAFPQISRVGILSNPLHPGEPRELKQTLLAAEQLGLKCTYVEMRSAAELTAAFARLDAEATNALMVLPDALAMNLRMEIIELARRRRWPSVSGWALFARSGGAMTYGPNLKESFKRLAPYIDKILKGANPADLPVEQPTKFELVINLKASKALGLAIPPTVLARADEIIE